MAFSADGVAATETAGPTQGLSVIIVTYRPGDELISCLRSIETFIKCPKEIIISDNSVSESAVLDEVAVNYPEVKIVRNARNGGFSFGNNIAAAESKHPFLLFMNPDSELLSPVTDPNELITTEAGIVSGVCLDADNKYKRTAGIFPTWPFRLFFLSRRLDARGALANGEFNEKKAEVDYTEGSLYLMRRYIFEEVGGFDESIFLYGEDYELSYRVHLAGYKNYISPKLIYRHAGGFQHAREPLVVNGLLYFANKHLGLGRRTSVRSVLISRYVALMVLSGIVAPFRPTQVSRLRSLMGCLVRCLQP